MNFHLTNTCNDINTSSSSDSSNNSLYVLSESELSAIRSECAHYEDMRAVSIEALKIVQKNRGWISDDAIAAIAQILCISVADLEGVATFYNQIFRQPVGRHIIRYCDSVVCYLAACEEVRSCLIDILGITIGDTTVDHRFTLLPVCCIGMCDKAPVIMINDKVHYYIRPEKITQLLEYYL